MTPDQRMNRGLNTVDNAVKAMTWETGDRCRPCDATGVTTAGKICPYCGGGGTLEHAVMKRVQQLTLTLSKSDPLYNIVVGLVYRNYPL